MNRFFILIFLLFIFSQAHTQISIGASYLHSADFHDDDNVKKGEVNTSLIEGNINLPLHMNISEDRRKVKVWTGFVSGKYLRMNETSSPELYPIDKVLNMYAGISHYRTLNDKWSLSAIGGMGLCTHDTRFSHLGWQNVMVYGLGTAIYKVNDKLELGIGIILTNAFNVPMAFPSIYVRWRGQGKYSFELSTRTYDIISSLGIEISQHFRLSLFADYNRISTPLKDENNKDYYYSFNYMSTGLRPEIRLNNNISIPIEVGVAFGGSGQYKKRKLSNIMKSEDSYSFGACPYISVAVRVGM